MLFKTLVHRYLLLLLVVASGHVSVWATGKGPGGIYAINDRYALFVDSSIDALLAVDLHRGGVVGHYILHDLKFDHLHNKTNVIDGHVKLQGWLDPTGVASCHNCKDIILSSTFFSPHLWRIHLEEPLWVMAQREDFSALGRAKMSPYINQTLLAVSDGRGRLGHFEQTDIEPFSEQDHGLRMMTMDRYGGLGFLAHCFAGVYAIDANDHSGRIPELVIPSTKFFNITKIGLDHLPQGAKLFDGVETLSGVGLSRGGRYLAVTLSHSVKIFDLGDPTYETNYFIPVNKLCVPERRVHFRNAALVGPYLFVTGHKYTAGAAIFRLERQEEGETTTTTAKDEKKPKISWTNCKRVVGGNLFSDPGWVDGVGQEGLFTRPHNMVVLPSDDAIVTTDIDNRALRYVNITTATMERDEEDEGSGLAEVSTVVYDEDLWRQLYGGFHRGGIVPEKKPASFIFASSSKETMSMFDADLVCAQKGARLCSTTEVRYLSETIAELHGSAWVWTDRSCFSCWLHFPGYCGPANESKDLASAYNKSSWGSDHYILNAIGAGGDRITSRCRLRDERVEVLPLCCSDDVESSRMFTAVI